MRRPPHIRRLSVNAALAVSVAALASVWLPWEELVAGAAGLSRRTVISTGIALTGIAIATLLHRRDRLTTAISPQPRLISWWWMPMAAIVVLATIVTTTAWLLNQVTALPPGAGQVTARIEAVRTGLTAGAGAGAAMALLLAFRRQHHQERATASLDHDAAERRITELYTKAVEQVGSDKAAVRLGGLYALERLAQNHPNHRQTIVDVFCAYLRMPFLIPSHLPAPTPTALPEATSGALTHELLEDSTAVGPASDRSDKYEEQQVRLTAQRILTAHLRNDRTPKTPSPILRPASLWTGIRLDLTGATLVDFDFTNCHAAKALFNEATFINAARFGGASFHTAEFCGATFTGDATFGKATFRGGVRFQGATFAGDARFRKATFRTARFDGVTVTGHGEFRGATFKGDAKFDGATFAGVAGFCWATFIGAVGFDGVIFHGDSKFRGVTFKGDVRFDTATFHRDAWFGGATFVGAVWFGGVVFHRDAKFGRSTFASDARFDRAIFHRGTSFQESEFTGTAWFRYATFTGNTLFNKAIFKAAAVFYKANFTSTVLFYSTIFTRDAVFNGAAFARSARFAGATFTGAAKFGWVRFLDGPDAIRLDRARAYINSTHNWPEEWSVQPERDGVGVLIRTKVVPIAQASDEMES